MIRPFPTAEPVEAYQRDARADVVEIPLLLPGWQVEALETAAHQRGQTAGAMVRDLLRDFLESLPITPDAESEDFD